MGDQLIADFIGERLPKSTLQGATQQWKFTFCDGFYPDFANMHFKDKWDWLMPVVDKIESMGYFVMINRWTSVYTGSDGNRIQITTVEGPSKITNTYQAILQFIRWYNEQTKS